MPFWHLDATARAAWAAATSQQAQLEGLRDEWSGQMSVRYYSSADAHLATVTHATPIVDTTTTPRSLRLGAWVAESHVQDGTAAYAILAVPAGADIVRAEVSLAGAISDPGGRVRVDIGTRLRIYAAASLPADDIPSWVPTTAWEWTGIAGTRWSDVMNSSGTGAAPSQSGDPVGGNYEAQWAYGGVAYSPKNHELWMFGGGHDGTTINALSKWSIGSDSPSVSMVCAPTTVAARLSDWALGSSDYTSKAYHTETNPKPKSPHAYANNRYLDDVDEFLSFGLSNIDEPGGALFGSFKVAGFPRGGAQWRSDGYWPELNTTVGTYGVQSQLVFESYDRSEIFYARNSTGLFKYTSAGVKTSIGGMSGVNAYGMKGAAESDSLALIAGGLENNSGTGWRLWFMDLADGAVTAVTVAGTWPADYSNYGYHGLVWVPSLSKYFALLASLTSSPTGTNIQGLRLFSITQTAADAVTASEIALTETPPTRIDLLSCMEFDPTLGVLVIAASPAETLFALKVA